MSFQAVIFSLGTEEYGMPIEAVQEITRLAEVHTLPNAPLYVKGLISIRGQAIPLIELHKKFNIQSEKEAEYAIIVEIKDQLVGFAVEQVKEVRTIDNIAPPPAFVNNAFIEGIVNLPDRMIIQIYPAKILEDEEMVDLTRLLG